MVFQIITFTVLERSTTIDITEATPSRNTWPYLRQNRRLSHTGVISGDPNPNAAAARSYEFQQSGNMTVAAATGRSIRARSTAKLFWGWTRYLGSANDRQPATRYALSRVRAAENLGHRGSLRLASTDKTRCELPHHKPTATTHACLRGARSLSSAILINLKQRCWDNAH